jgi:N-acetyl-gamma-glutamyl-phosphate reductase
VIRVGILGARGYTAGEALRLLVNHPEVEITCLMARGEEPEPVTASFPSLRGLIDLEVEPTDAEAMATRCDAVFLCLPHTTAQEFAPTFLKAGVRIIDGSADFRFDSIQDYEATYKVKHLAPELNDRFPYALPELFGDDLRDAPGAACPGCYPTAALLALAPLMGAGELFEYDRVVIDAMTGVSGAGKSLNPDFLFVECNESIRPYNVGMHRHRPEIAEKLTRLAGSPVRVTFTAHLVPITRGILSTATVRTKAPVTLEQLHERYRAFYEGKPFVRLLPPGELPNTSAVEKTNFCDIGVTVDEPAGTVIINSAIDNLTKGSTGQGVQVMNLMFGLPETLGLLPSSGRRVHA